MIEAVAHARLRQRLLDIAGRQIERAPQPRLDPLRRAQRRHRVRRAARSGAGSPRAASSPSRRLSTCTSSISAESPPRLGLAPAASASAVATPAPLLARLQRPEAGRPVPPRPERPRASVWQKAWIVWMRRPAARRVEHAREQRAGAFASAGSSCASPSASRSWRRSASRIRTQLREPRVDALRHLGRARLGEGQAQDRGGIDAGEQQPQHARRQHLGLAGAGRGRQPDLPARVRRRRPARPAMA